MEDLLPSQLCTICHANPPKYRCPRCSARTCSLPCTRRHKKWAQCTGVRDPTRYVKRAELATPGGIDHDFNFLTSIERNLDRAERDAERRGVDVQEGHHENWKSWKERGLSGPVKGETQMRTALQEYGVVVQRAPKGMARAKQNRTQWHKKRHTLIWTVEWILKDGTSEIGSCAANVAIADAYAAQFATTSASKKHKRALLPTDLTSSKNAVPATESLRRSSSNPPLLEPAPAVPSPPSPNGLLDHNRPPSLTSESPPIPPLPPSQQLPPPPSSPPLHFYLLHPCTPSPTRVLIPLSPTSTLASSLQNRVVLEFPTIYVLRYAPDTLPTGFITEETYFGNTRPKMRIEEIEAMLQHDDNVDGQRTSDASEGLNPKRLEEVLKRDLNV